jgi:hypothetical protein
MIGEERLQLTRAKQCVEDELSGRTGVAARGEFAERSPELGEQAGPGNFAASVTEDVDVTHHLSSMMETPGAGRASALRPELTDRWSRR